MQCSQENYAYLKIGFVITGWIVFLSWFVYSSLHFSPSEFYSTESGDDLKYLFSSEIKKAKRSIYLASFGFSDPEIATLLQSKALDGVKIEILCDGREALHMEKLPTVSFYSYFGKGLMHRKIVAMDQERILLGSTNLTPFSLEIHRNLVVKVESPELFTAILDNLPFMNSSFSFYPLPIAKSEALYTFIQKIHHSKKRIFAAIYTFTHPEIVSAFIAAKERGVDVRVYLDRSMARGTCKQVAKKLLAHNIPVKINLRDGLLHYKCALIDNDFIFGSANWTKAAFEKNQEYLIAFHTFKHLDVLEKFFKSLDRSSFKLSNNYDTF